MCFAFPVRLQWRKQFFLCKRVSSEDTFLIRGGSPRLSLLSVGTQSGLNLSSPVHAASLCEHLWAPVLLGLEDTDSSESSLPLALTVFPRSFLHNSLSPDGRDLMWTFHLGQCSQVSQAALCPVVGLCLSLQKAAS